MAEAAVPTIKPGQCFIIGRINNVERTERGYFTRVTCPAPDSWSHPATVMIESEHRLGQKDDDIRVLCAVGGYVNDFKTGKGDLVRSARNTLKALG